MSYRTVLLFGAPGSGKGTQGKILGALPGYFHFACGDVFRSLDKQSEMGMLFSQYSRSGALVPDELTVELWRQSIAATVASGRYKPDEQVLLLDGIPRTVEQAKIMASHLHVLGIINLFINDVEQIVARLSRRAQIENRPDDTNIEVIRYRIEVYEEQTQPLLNYYTHARMLRVNATQAPEQVTADILNVVRNTNINPKSAG